MLKRVFASVLVFVCCSSASAMGKKGDWIGSFGMGITSDPGLFLISPQAEYVFRPNLFFGPLVQMGFGAGGTLYTASATARLVMGHHPNLRPSLEAGLGITASSLFSSTLGVLLQFGVGFDYMFTPAFGLGTVFRGNLAPPVKTFFLSWPILVLRLLI